MRFYAVSVGLTVGLVTVTAGTERYKQMADGTRRGYRSCCCCCCRWVAQRGHNVTSSSCCWWPLTTTA
uniref:Putative secreted protein n=1 Tax=Anopheles darlingi TaxID=43151 RepID=A0A2M4D5L2_ANODA